jgi:hypothetical protein
LAKCWSNEKWVPICYHYLLFSVFVFLWYISEWLVTMLIDLEQPLPLTLCFISIWVTWWLTTTVTISLWVSPKSYWEKAANARMFGKWSQDILIAKDGSERQERKVNKRRVWCQVRWNGGELEFNPTLEFWYLHALKLLPRQGSTFVWPSSVIGWGLLLGDINSSALTTCHVHGHSKFWWQKSPLLIIQEMSVEKQLSMLRNGKSPNVMASHTTSGHWSEQINQQYFLHLTMIGPEGSMWSRLGQWDLFHEFFCLESRC